MKLAFIAIGIFVVTFGVLGKFYEYRDRRKLEEQIKADSEKNRRPETRYTFSNKEQR